MLGREVDRQSPEPLLEVPASASADDVHVRRGKRGERAQESPDLGRRLREVGVELELAERPVVVEQDRALPGAGEAARDPLLDRVVHRRRPLRPAVAARIAAESRQEALGPAPGVEVLDPLRHRLQPALPLASRQLEGRSEMLDDPVDVPRVHEERARKHLRSAGELARGAALRASVPAGRARTGRARTRGRRGSSRRGAP